MPLAQRWIRSISSCCGSLPQDFILFIIFSPFQYTVLYHKLRWPPRLNTEAIVHWIQYFLCCYFHFIWSHFLVMQECSVLIWLLWPWPLLVKIMTIYDSLYFHEATCFLAEQMLTLSVEFFILRGNIILTLNQGWEWALTVLTRLCGLIILT